MNLRTSVCFVFLFSIVGPVLGQGTGQDCMESVWVTESVAASDGSYVVSKAFEVDNDGVFSNGSMTIEVGTEVYLLWVWMDHYRDGVLIQRIPVSDVTNIPYYRVASNGLAQLGGNSDFTADIPDNIQTTVNWDSGDFQMESCDELRISVRYYMPGQLETGVDIRQVGWDPTPGIDDVQLACGTMTYKGRYHVQGSGYPPESGSSQWLMDLGIGLECPTVYEDPETPGRWLVDFTISNFPAFASLIADDTLYYAQLKAIDGNNRWHDGGTYGNWSDYGGPVNETVTVVLYENGEFQNSEHLFIPANIPGEDHREMRAALVIYEQNTAFQHLIYLEGIIEFEIPPEQGECIVCESSAGFGVSYILEEDWESGTLYYGTDASNQGEITLQGKQLLKGEHMIEIEFNLDDGDVVDVRIELSKTSPQKSKELVGSHTMDGEPDCQDCGCAGEIATLLWKTPDDDDDGEPDDVEFDVEDLPVYGSPDWYPAPFDWPEPVTKIVNDSWIVSPELGFDPFHIQEQNLAMTFDLPMPVGGNWNSSRQFTINTIPQGTDEMSQKVNELRGLFKTLGNVLVVLTFTIATIRKLAEV